MELGQRTAAERLRRELNAEHPESVPSKMGLALVLEKEGRLADAVEHNRRAVAAAPEEAPPQRELVSRLMRLEKLDEAVLACREALRVAPSDSELHTLLGMALLHQARSVPREREPPSALSASSKRSETEAFRHLRLACQLSLNSFQAFDKLAWVLATYPDAHWRNGAEAVELAERVCGQTDFRVAETLGTLAVAYAEAGRFPEAINVAQRAQALSRSLGQMQMAELQGEWINLFRAKQPYREQLTSFGTKASQSSPTIP